LLLMDLLGNILKTVTVKSNERATKISLIDLPNDVYIVRWNSGDHLQEVQFFVKSY